MTVEYIWIQGENGATMMAKQPEPDPKGLFGDKGMTFKDALDIINPLQQIPIVGSIYRSLTGDTISDGARLIGGGIYGLGVLGMIGAAASSAVEQTTGSDPGGTVIAMIKGKSLGEQVASAKADHDKTQLASAQYYSGGADPIDPTSLPAGAKLVDVPVPGANPRALAALPEGAAAPGAAAPAAAPGTPATPSATPAAAAGALAGVAGPRGNVAVSQLPPLIGQAGGPVGAPTGDAGLIPSVPAMPAGATGLSAISHLPTAGAITPAAASLAAASLQSNSTPAPSPVAAAGLTPAAIAAGTAAPRMAAAVGTAPAADAATQGFALHREAKSFPVPPRTNNITPRMPVPDTHANVGTQPLALSMTDTPTLHAVKVTPPQTAEAPAASTAAAPASAAAAPTALAAPAPAAANAPLANPMATLPAAQIPDAMMRALDKYDALMKSRRNNGQVDQTL